ncbi:uncharacterized protein KY384_004378 [Bacidia gigantensis]|uniref:uncharacterized protein n=1 Tax=Bacidia gigantensis TaxID=2732470 RepID=UPI001D03770B|nr:uncharacterized protein KY384_004378 [Bacidia gigantensis]KAG8531021.1 hypothetical protein KY384_004378 [Bacidia gigantensis]
MPKKSTQSTSTADLAPQTNIPNVFKDGLPIPKMFAFDLDYTLWPFWVDTHVTPPLKAKEGGAKSVDRFGESFAFYRDVATILATMKSLPSPPLLATASRTHTPDLAQTLLKQLTVPTTPWIPATTTFKPAREFFDQHQIFPGDKKTHMTRLSEKTGVAFEDILFFDDETRNRNVETLGVTFWLVRDGVTWAEVERGVREWRRRNAKDGK